MDRLRQYHQGAPADLCVNSRTGWTIVHEAVERGHSGAMLTMVVQIMGPDSVNKKTRTGLTPAHVAASKRDTVALMALANLGADLSVLSADRCSCGSSRSRRRRPRNHRSRSNKRASCWRLLTPRRSTSPSSTRCRATSPRRKRRSRRRRSGCSARSCAASSRRTPRGRAVRDMSRPSSERDICPMWSQDDLRAMCGA